MFSARATGEIGIEPDMDPRRIPIEEAFITAQFLDALEVGVVEEAVRSCGYDVDISLQLESSHTGLMLVRFRPSPS